jgi:hypothetical protein
MILQKKSPPSMDFRQFYRELGRCQYRCSNNDRLRICSISLFRFATATAHFIECFLGWFTITTYNITNPQPIHSKYQVAHSIEITNQNNKQKKDNCWCDWNVSYPKLVHCFILLIIHYRSDNLQDKLKQK